MEAKVRLFAGLKSRFHSPKVEPTKVLSHIGEIVGSVVKKRRKKMRKHKQRKLLKRQRHKK
jgi:hypothetical protein